MRPTQANQGSLLLLVLLLITALVTPGTVPETSPALNPESHSPIDAITPARSIVGQEYRLATGFDTILAGNLQQVLRNLDTTEGLVEIHSADHRGDLHRGIALAQEATRHQSATLGVPWLEPVPLAGHSSPSAALLELAARHNVTPTPQELENIHGHDGTPEPLRGALVGFLDAFLALDTAARIAYEDAEPSVLKELEAQRGPRAALEGPIQPLEALQGAGIDLSLVFRTRNQFLDSIGHLQHVLQETPIPTQRVCEPVQLPLVFSVDLTHCDNHYRQYYALILNLGGNDTYHNNAGGNSLGEGCSTVRSPAAALVDLGEGDDAYGDPQNRRYCGVNGGGRAGVGFLFDDGGNDVYRAQDRATNGGGYLGGIGFLLNVHGNDVYRAADSGTNGGGHLGGMGLLLDLEGDDVYLASHLGTNGGATNVGAGFLFDGGGDDEFRATRSGTNGGTDYGTGFLVSLAGNDTFTATHLGTNGGGFFGGVGHLFNAGGDNSYTATRSGTNGGGVFFGGVGFLLDVGGNDRYEATGCGINGGSDDSLCSMLIGSGLGFLLDFGGEDEYIDDVVGHCWDCSIVPKGAFGAQIDSDDQWTEQTTMTCGDEEIARAEDYGIDNA